MTNDEALALDRGDVVRYNGRQHLVVALLGAAGTVRTIRLTDRNTDSYAPPHKVTLVRKGPASVNDLQ